MNIWSIWLRSSEGRNAQCTWKREYARYKVWHISFAALTVLQKHIVVDKSFNREWQLR